MLQLKWEMSFGIKLSSHFESLDSFLKVKIPRKVWKIKKLHSNEKDRFDQTHWSHLFCQSCFIS